MSKLISLSFKNLGIGFFGLMNLQHGIIFFNIINFFDIKMFKYLQDLEHIMMK